jgi:hypothetical protein
MVLPGRGWTRRRASGRAVRLKIKWEILRIMCVGFASHRVIQIVTVLPALAAAMAVGLASAGAEAADLPQSYKAAPSYTTPQPAFSWTGFYAGFNAGGGQSSDNAHNNLLGVSGGRLRGALAGLEGGYNYQL